MAHTKETEVDHMRFNASYKAMQVCVTGSNTDEHVCSTDSVEGALAGPPSISGGVDSFMCINHHRLPFQPAQIPGLNTVLYCVFVCHAV